MPDDPPSQTTRMLDLPGGTRRGSGAPAYQTVFSDGWLAVGWYGEVTLEGLDAWRDGIEEVDRQTAGLIGQIVCVRESSPPPEGELRRAAAKLIFDDRLAVSMLVFEGTGFRAAIVRSVLAMMFTIGGRRTIAHKVIGDPREATQWFWEHSADFLWRPDTRDLRQVIDALLGAR